VLEELNKIQKAEPSPYLFSRIQQKIRNNQNEYFTGKMMWTVLASFSLVVILNVVALNYQMGNSNSENYENSLIPNNSLYNE
jgi:hypothetical protein